MLCRLTALLVALFGALAPLSAQDAPGDVRVWEHESSDIQVDPRIHFGHFDNGLRYAWVANSEPQDRCYLRLHVNVGSLAETDAETGMAHFLEHMAFNGTENFEPGTLIEWFQEHGMSFGADTNAHTSFSETVYKLDLPYSDAETLGEGLQVLRDFATGILNEEEEVQAEKGVIDGEQRERDSAGFRVFMELLDRLYDGTRYPERLPIGEKAVRDEFTAESVEAFYRRWYRPENMTLVVVGDLGDLDPVPLIKQHFAGLATPESAPLKEPDKGEPSMEELFFSLYEPELPQTSIQVQMLLPWEERPFTKAMVLEDLPLSIANRMLNLRFSEIVKKEEDAPFLNAAATEAGGLLVFDGAALSVATEAEKWEAALMRAENELRRALEHGFQEAELEELRANYLRNLDEAVEREKTRSSRGLLAEILGAAEQRTVPTNAETDRRLYKPAVEALTVEECHAALVEAWNEGTLSIVASGNLDLGEDGGAKLLAVWEAAGEIEVEEGEAIETATFAYAADPEKAGEVLSEEYVEDLDLWLVELKNGVQLTIKKTDFKDREIQVRARVGEGGLTLPSEDYALAWMANQVFTAGGLEAHTAEEIRRLHAGLDVSVSFSVEDDHFALGGVTDPDDLQRQFELMCAFLQYPGWRPDGMRQFKPRIALIFQQLEHLTQGPLALEFLPEMFSQNWRLLPLLPQERLEAVTMEAIQEWLGSELEGSPVEVTLVGDLDVRKTIQLAARTFGTLPEARALRGYGERRAIALPKSGLDMERAIQTQIPKSLVFLAFPTPDGLEAQRRRDLIFLANILDDRVRVDIREELGTSYSPGAAAQPSTIFPGLGMIVIQAEADPQDAARLKEAALAVAANLAENGVTQEEVDRLKEPQLTSLREAMRSNGFWLSQLSGVHTGASELDDLRTVEEYFDAPSMEALNELASEYLQPERASVLVVNPAG